jgi:mycothiol synthase
MVPSAPPDLRIEVTHRPGPETLSTVGALLAAVEATDGHHPLSDDVRLALSSGSPDVIAFVARSSPGAVGPVGGEQSARGDGGRGEVIGYAQLGRNHRGWSLEIAVHPGARDHRATVMAGLLEAARHAVADAGGGQLQLWTFHPGVDDDRVARSAGLTPGRDLLQMRRPMPVPGERHLDTRPFRPGVDEAPWLTVNNRAFASHPEQGGWSLETLLARESEPWFDPAGFLLHERDGRLAASCWTKMHTRTDSVMGEIYVISVDPDFQGLGLGKALTLAGLDHIAATGAPVGMLYVDAANTPAVKLYRGLGFTVDHTDRAYVGTVRVA